MRPDFLGRFHRMVDELRASPDVAVARVHVAPPVSDETIARVHAGLGFTLSDTVLALYRQANGLALEWIPKDHSAYDPANDDRESSAPFDLVPQDVPGGVIHLYPLESLLDDYEDHLWFEWMAGQTTELGGRPYDLLAFSKAIRPFDYYSERAMAALFLGDRAPEPPVLLGDDHGATFTSFAPMDFSTYVEAVLALRGSGVGRDRFLCREGAAATVIEAPPSLDTLIGWSLEHERAFQERDEDDFDGGDIDDEADFDTSGEELDEDLADDDSE